MTNIATIVATKLTTETDPHKTNSVLMIIWEIVIKMHKMNQIQIFSGQHTFADTTPKVIVDTQWINNIEMLGNKGLPLIFSATREDSIN